MHRHARHTARSAAVALLSLVACADATAPARHRYPDVAGTYAFEATLEPLPPASGWTLTLVQPDRDGASLTGTLRRAPAAPADVDVGPLEIALERATVTPGGVVTFHLREYGDLAWRFVGVARAGAIAGTHRQDVALSATPRAAPAPDACGDGCSGRWRAVRR